MKIERHQPLFIGLAQFAEKHDLTMEIHERGHFSRPDSRFYAHFKETEVKDGGCLIGTYGNGATEDEAMANYATAISGKRIVVGAYTDRRTEHDVPKLVYLP